MQWLACLLLTLLLQLATGHPVPEDQVDALFYPPDKDSSSDDAQETEDSPPTSPSTVNDSLLANQPVLSQSTTDASISSYSTILTTTPFSDAAVPNCTLSPSECLLVPSSCSPPDCQTSASFNHSASLVTLSLKSAISPNLFLALLPHDQDANGRKEAIACDMEHEKAVLVDYDTHESMGSAREVPWLVLKKLSVLDSSVECTMEVSSPNRMDTVDEKSHSLLMLVGPRFSTEEKDKQLKDNVKISTKVDVKEKSKAHPMSEEESMERDRKEATTRRISLTPSSTSRRTTVAKRTSTESPLRNRASGSAEHIPRKKEAVESEEQIKGRTEKEEKRERHHRKHPSRLSHSEKLQVRKSELSREESSMEELETTTRHSMKRTTTMKASEEDSEDNEEVNLKETLELLRNIDESIKHKKSHSGHHSAGHELPGKEEKGDEADYSRDVSRDQSGAILRNAENSGDKKEEEVKKTTTERNPTSTPATSSSSSSTTTSSSSSAEDDDDDDDGSSSFVGCTGLAVVLLSRLFVLP